MCGAGLRVLANWRQSAGLFIAAAVPVVAARVILLLGAGRWTTTSVIVGMALLRTVMARLKPA